MQKPIVTMEMENGDIIKMELYPNKVVKSRVITRSPYGGGKDRPVEPPVMKKVTVASI